MKKFLAVLCCILLFASVVCVSAFADDDCEHDWVFGSFIRDYIYAYQLISQGAIADRDYQFFGTCISKYVCSICGQVLITFRDHDYVCVGYGGGCYNDGDPEYEFVCSICGDFTAIDDCDGDASALAYYLKWSDIYEYGYKSTYEDVKYYYVPGAKDSSHAYDRNKSRYGEDGLYATESYVLAKVAEEGSVVTTPTPAPTATPAPTNTPEPVVTPTPTPIVTPTPTPAVTSTPVPTTTPAPTATSQPTPSPVPIIPGSGSGSGSSGSGAVSEAISTETVSGVLDEIIGILPVTLPVVVGFLGFRKGWRFIYSLLHKS